eukprot:scaffold9857_cov195-Amphora_coffeaeformis.AAC.6
MDMYRTIARLEFVCQYTATSLLWNELRDWDRHGCKSGSQTKYDVPKSAANCKRKPAKTWFFLG